MNRLSRVNFNLIFYLFISEINLFKQSRYAEKFEINNISYRILVKAYGLRFFFVVNGKAGKFDFIPLLLTTGAGFGLLALPTIIADFILLNCTKKRKFYKQLKEADSSRIYHRSMTKSIHNRSGITRGFRPSSSFYNAKFNGLMVPEHASSS
jgi:hypothetical protein